MKLKNERIFRLGVSHVKTFTVVLAMSHVTLRICPGYMPSPKQIVSKNSVIVPKAVGN